MAEKPLAVIDCETDPFQIGRIPSPFVWGLFNGSLFLTFRETESLVNYLRKNPLTVYAHNGGRFDFIFLQKYLEPETEMKMINGRLAEARIGETVIRDSYLIFPQALKSYNKKEIDYSKLEKENREQYWDEIIDYLFWDCQYLYEIVSEFQKKYGKRLTLASSALGYWKKEFQGTTPIWSSVEKAQRYYDKIYPYYSGGRVEVFEKGIVNEKIVVADINSAYPFAMMHNHPWGADPIERCTLPETDINLCLITLIGKSKGYFPFKTKNGTQFPNDGEIRQFHVSGYEYLAVMEIEPEYKATIVKVLQFTQSIHFREYVSHFFSMKKNAEKGSLEYNFAKIMQNALYGKLASDPRNHRRYMFAAPDRVNKLMEETEFKPMDIQYPYVLMEAPLKPSQMKGSYYDVATASSITGFVRAYLLKELHRANRPFYCDTDCIHALAFNGNVGKELGQWNIEFEATIAAYAGKKLYALSNDFTDCKKKDCPCSQGGDCKQNTKKAHKGAKLSKSDIFKIARGETITWNSEAPSMGINKETTFISRRIRMN